jgi:SAM-dependent methyltransferase
VGQTATRTDIYWDSYYTSRDVPVLPSQFAVFCLGEFSAEAVVDVGCGSGRDSFFFARHGILTIGVDASTSAVDLCRRQAHETGAQNIHFLQADVCDETLDEQVTTRLANAGVASGLLLYSRFFLHAIDDEAQSQLLATASNILDTVQGVFALEFRTTRDRSLEKATPHHFRRYVDPATLVSLARDHRLAPRYSVEGFGMAKYRQDDAYVCRVLLERI